MRIVHVNNTDLPGRRFNGYDMHLSLNEMGHEARQFVVKKESDIPTVIPLCRGHEYYWQTVLVEYENNYGMDGVINPNGYRLSSHPEFRSSDLMHYHIVRNGLVSLTDLPRLTKLKPSVWTIHELSFLTGGCFYPFDCEGWKSDCRKCQGNNTLRVNTEYSSSMLQFRRSIARQMDIDYIVASDFTRGHIEDSAVTGGLDLRVHKIPFGVYLNDFNRTDRGGARHKLNIPQDAFVLSFRCDGQKQKGCKYIYEALEQLPESMRGDIIILTVGWDKLPKSVTDRFNSIELGWCNDNSVIENFYKASDVFLMPSLAETFGLMAIEAMASACPVVAFEDTVLQEIIFAPDCGIALKKKDSESLANAIMRLYNNPSECIERGELGRKLASEHYRYEDYVRRHLELYSGILERGGGV